MGDRSELQTGQSGSQRFHSEAMLLLTSRMSLLSWEVEQAWKDVAWLAECVVSNLYV